MEWRETNPEAADSEVVTVRHRERVNAVYKEKETELQRIGSVSVHV